MGKTSKWLRSFLIGKKDKDKEKKWNGISQNSTITDGNPTTPVSIPQTPPKEKRRWSFRRSSASATASRELSPAELNINNTAATVQTTFEADEQRKHAIDATAADAAAAAAQVNAAVIRLNASSNGTGFSIEEAAAIKIQSVFRSYLARKALCALKGLVKLQALVRGHLVRKQANATLRCMQALVTAQARALAQRIRVSDGVKPNQKQSIHRKSTQENRSRSPYQEIERSMEENIKIVEMDYGESNGNSRNRKNYLNNPENEWSEKGLAAQFAAHSLNSKQENHHYSPAPSALTDFSPRAYSGHFEDCSFNTAQSSPQYYSAVSKSDDSKIPFAFPRPSYAEQMAYDYPLFPNYMANTESSKAKVRSQSAPKQRPDSFERQPSRRRASIEGRNVPRAVRMQRSSSHVGSTSKNYQYPWSLKLDKSTVSLKDSECGSTSTVLTNTNYCRSLVAYNPHGDRY